MSKKITFILIILIVILLGIGLWFFFSSPNKTSENENLSIRDFFPFGKSPETVNKIVNKKTDEEPITSRTPPRLRKISENPTSGAISFDIGDETFIRFVDRATGHVWEASSKLPRLQRLTNTTVPKIQEAIWTDKNAVILRFLKEDEETIESVLLRLIPQGSTKENIFEFREDLKLGDNSLGVLNLQEILNSNPETKVAESGVGSPNQETTYFGSKTELAVKKFQEKYSDEILEPQNLEEPSGVVDELTRAKLNELTGASQIINTAETNENEDKSLFETILTFLPSDIKSLTYLDKLQKIFYLQEDSLGTIGTLSEINGNQKVQIFESPATEWGVKSIDGQSIALSTKASNNQTGVIFILETDGSMKKVLGDLNGLTGLINSKKTKLAYSETKKDGAVFRILNLDNLGKINTFIETLPEKCVWSKKEPIFIYCAIPKSPLKKNYLDNWYQGLISFPDSLLKIDTEIGIPVLTPEGELKDNPIDAVELMLSPDEQYLIFTNKKDYSLWSLQLFDPKEILEDDSETATTTTETGGSEEGSE